MKHFTPNYEPWDQRLCVVPDGDLFKILREGHASVETDHIEKFTETGIQLKSGKHLDADIIVSARFKYSDSGWYSGHDGRQAFGYVEAYAVSG